MKMGRGRVSIQHDCSAMLFLKMWSLELGTAHLDFARDRKQDENRQLMTKPVPFMGTFHFPHTPKWDMQRVCSVSKKKPQRRQQEARLHLSKWENLWSLWTIPVWDLRCWNTCSDSARPLAAAQKPWYCCALSGYCCCCCKWPGVWCACQWLQEDFLVLSGVQAKISLRVLGGRVENRWKGWILVPGF